MSEVFRQFRIEPQMFAGDRVHKAKRFGVQALAVRSPRDFSSSEIMGTALLS